MVGAVRDTLCSGKGAVSLVKVVLGAFGVGRVIIGILDVACVAGPVIEDANTICSGLSTCELVPFGCSYISFSKYEKMVSINRWKAGAVGPLEQPLPR